MGSRLEIRKQMQGISPKTTINQGHLKRLVDNWGKRDFPPVNRKAERAGRRRDAKRERKINNCLERCLKEQYRKYIGVQSWITARN